MRCSKCWSTPGLHKAYLNYIPHQSELEMHLIATDTRRAQDFSRSPGTSTSAFPPGIPIDRRGSSSITGIRSTQRSHVCGDDAREHPSQELSDVSLRSMGIAAKKSKKIKASCRSCCSDRTNYRTDPVCGNRLLLGTRAHTSTSATAS